MFKTGFDMIWLFSNYFVVAGDSFTCKIEKRHFFN